jgi:predicted signal transduction protein with EAL and GGDEF domain
VIAAVAVTAYAVLQVGVFVAQGAKPVANTIELDELPILGMVLSIGLLIFAWRRMQQQKRETATRVEARSQLSKMAFQDPLTGLPNRCCLMESLRVAVLSPASNRRGSRADDARPQRFQAH